MIVKAFKDMSSDKIVKSSGTAAADAVKTRDLSEGAFGHAVRQLVSEDPEKDYRKKQKRQNAQADTVKDEVIPVHLS